MKQSGEIVQSHGVSSSWGLVITLFAALLCMFEIFRTKEVKEEEKEEGEEEEEGAVILTGTIKS